MKNLTREEYQKCLRTLTKIAGQGAGDALQEAAIELCGLPTPPDNPVAWLVARARLRAADAWRAAATRERYHGLAMTDAPSATVHDPETFLSQKRALERLSPAYREVLLAGACRTEPATSTQRSHALRARRALAELMA